MNRIKTGIIIIIVTLFVMWYLDQDDKQYVYSDTTIYIVMKGDTLWDIAKKYSDNRFDVRRVVYEIEQINDINANIQVNDVLIIPLYDSMNE